MAYSTCIARVFFNIRESRIRGVFRTLNIGEIERVDMIKKTGKDKKNFWCVFIHWANLSEEVCSALNQNDGVVTIEYDQPWYWKMTKSHARRPVRRAAPTLSIGGVKTRPTRPVSQRTATDEWVDVTPKGDNPTGVAVNLRTDTLPHLSGTTAPQPPALNRQPSGKDNSVEASIAREEEMRDAAMKWAKGQAEGTANAKTEEEEGSD